MRDYPVIDADGHVFEPDSLWERYLEPRFLDWPDLCILESAYGAGNDQRDERPNVLRLVLAETIDDRGDHGDRVTEVTFEVDDMTPEELGEFRRRLPQDLCLDVSISPCHMKKDRPGQRVTLIVPAGGVDQVEEAIFRNTTTFGFRTADLGRRTLERKMLTVETSFGGCPVKVGIWRGDPVRVHPGADDVARLAAEAGVSFREVSDAATARAWEELRS